MRELFLNLDQIRNPFLRHRHQALVLHPLVQVYQQLPPRLLRTALQLKLHFAEQILLP
jgi:hypothetical protein